VTENSAIFGVNTIRRFYGLFASLAPLYKTLDLLTYLLTYLLISRI